MFLPRKNLKYQKQHTRNDSVTALQNVSKLAYGNFALIADESGKLNAKQIESIKMSIKRKFKRQVKVWVQIAANKMVTKKPNQIRLGKGKGAVKYWIHSVKPGKILLEAKGFNSSEIANNLKELNYSFNIRTRTKSKLYRWIL